MKKPVELLEAEAKLEALLAEREAASAEYRAKVEAGDEAEKPSLDLYRKESELKELIRSYAPLFEVGDGVTVNGYTDRYPFEVIEVSKNGKVITIRELSAELDPEWKPDVLIGGFSGHTVNNYSQKWNLSSNENNAIRKYSLRTTKVDPTYWGGRAVRNRWIEVGVSAATGSTLSAGARKFHDYNF